MELRTTILGVTGSAAKLSAAKPMRKMARMCAVNWGKIVAAQKARWAKNEASKKA
jgi:hypothetical protein